MVLVHWHEPSFKMKSKFKVGDRVRYARADNFLNMTDNIFWKSGLEIIITEINTTYNTISGSTLNSKIINGWPNGTNCGNMAELFQLIKSHRADYYLPPWF